MNILSKKDFDGLKEELQLLKTNVKVYPYMFSKALNLYGKLRVSVTSDLRRKIVRGRGLHSDSRQFTTFSTHVGLFRYKRLNFGLSCAAEVFQKKVSDTLNGIPCVKNTRDDIYVGGTDKDTHDYHLRQVFHRLHENGLTINLPKCQFRVPTMLFFGHVFSEKGMSPDPKKVEALQNVTPPTNASEVRSLLSSAAFSSQFIKDFALITADL